MAVHDHEVEKSIIVKVDKVHAPSYVGSRKFQGWDCIFTKLSRARTGIQMIPAYSPQARGRSERNFGTWQGRLPQELRLHGIASVEKANEFLRKHYIAEFNRSFQVRAGERAGRESGEHGELSASPLADRSGTLASHPGGLHGAGASTSGRESYDHPRTAASGSIQRGRKFVFAEHDRATSCGKDAGWKSPNTDFSTPLGNPAQCAGFPLSHNLGYGWLIQKPDRSCATKSGHFNLLRTSNNSVNGRLSKHLRRLQTQASDAPGAHACFLNPGGLVSSLSSLSLSRVLS